MQYTCSVCNQKVDGGLVVYTTHTEKHIVDLVKHDHPGWVEKDGICQKCFQYYKEEIEGSTLKDADCALRQRRIKGLWAKVTGFFSGKAKS